MYIEDHRRAAELWQKRRKHEKVRHGMNVDKAVTLSAMPLIQYHRRVNQEPQDSEKIGRLAYLVDHSLLNSVNVYAFHVHMRRLAHSSQRNDIHLVPALYESVAILLYASIAFIEGVGDHRDS